MNFRLAEKNSSSLAKQKSMPSFAGKNIKADVQDKQPHVIDLFAGVGGISLGAARAGFNVTGAVDFNPRVMAAHQRNFPKTNHLTADLSGYTGEHLLSELCVSKPDGIIGGPPCQGFSAMGHRNVGDVRNSLFGHYFYLISQIKPRFFLAENVTGILDSNYQDIVDSALEHVEDEYHLLRGVEVCASDFGAPTSRRRVLFLGFLKDECNPASEADIKKSNASEVKVAEALTGMPSIRETWQTEEQGWRKVSEYPDTEFGRRLLNAVPTGVGCAESLKRLENLREVSGCLGTVHSPEVKNRYAKLKQGGKDSVSKSVRLKPDGFCPTLRAGTGPELGSYQAVRPIHPTASRVITPREAARLQGFPDWFRFDSTKWHSFRMIGNSVSPILAEHLLRLIRSKL
jgi:DNA (cytosine-5)-methyltransferase 1